MHKCLLALGEDPRNIYVSQPYYLSKVHGLLKHRKTPDEWRARVTELFRAKVKLIGDNGESMASVVAARDRL